jgi:hypothetical protein
MCSRIGVGVQLSSPYAHHMLGKAKRPWRTIHDDVYVMMHIMSMPKSMYLCAVITVVKLRNLTFSRAEGP